MKKQMQIKADFELEELGFEYGHYSMIFKRKGYELDNDIIGKTIIVYESNNKDFDYMDECGNYFKRNWLR